MNRFCILFIANIICIVCSAQSYMRIHHKGGGYSDIDIERIDSISFVDESDLPGEVSSLIGCWLWGNGASGYYELLTFNEDKTYTGYDNYFTYGFDTMTYGWYAQFGSMLTLQSNGFGYNHRYNWFVMGVTGNALDVMTKMGRFVYYRLQPETIRLKVGDSPLAFSNGDSFVFADGVVARITEEGLQGVSMGTTYVQLYIAESNCIIAYKVVVE